MAGDLSVLVHHKVRPPGLPAATISRPRLTRLYADLLRDHEAIAVFAAAGSGKTVQAQLFAAEEGWPLAWLTLDRADSSTTRMLTYLAAALEPHARGVTANLERAFTASTAVEEAAAVLAESLHFDRLLLVIDQCEAIAHEQTSCAALEAFLDYLPDGVRTILLSRSEMSFSLGRMLLHGRVGRVGDRDLGLTLDEARVMAETRCEDTSSLHDRWRAARGWVAGFAFGGEGRTVRDNLVNDFRSYVADEVLAGLPPEERQFLLDCSILDAVTQRSAEALCGPESRALWRSIATRHLPITISTDRAIVLHPCLRRHLREQLEFDDPDRLWALELRRGELLLEQGQHEDAVELFLRLGMIERAGEAAVAACQPVIERGDWETFLRWADLMGKEIVESDPFLVGQVLKSLRGVRRLHEARSLARQLRESGRLAAVIDADPSVIAHIAWSMITRPDEAVTYLDKFDHENRAVATRFMLEVTAGEDPATPPNGLPWADADRLVSWALMVQGRLDDLMRMLPRDENWPPRTPYDTPHPLIGLIWRGKVATARELFDQVPRSTKIHSHTDLWLNLEAWLLLAEGDTDGAISAAAKAVEQSRRTGFGFEPVFEIVQGSALISSGRVQEAIDVLHDALNSAKRSGLIAYAEWACAGLGRAHLDLHDDETALAHLRIAVSGMRRAQRHLMLPLAAVYLSEAEWRVGNHELADQAAAEALSAAAEMDARWALQVALSHFPSVYRRQLQRSNDPRWRRTSAAPGPDAPRPPSQRDGVAVDVHTFGDRPDILVGGVSTDVRRLKVLELVAFLANHPNGAMRDVLQQRLFPDSDRSKGSNHFRQVVHQLRKLTTITLERLPSQLITFSNGFMIDSADLRFERLVKEAGRLSGREQLDQYRRALDIVDGPYLSSSDLDWVADRRYELDVLHEQARLEVARLALEFNEYDLARESAESLLAHNPYSDPAYLVLIEAELAIGSEVGALAVYRRAAAALDEIGLRPGHRMVELIAEA